jgi:hypothetical protein
MRAPPASSQLSTLMWVATASGVLWTGERAECTLYTCLYWFQFFSLYLFRFAQFFISPLFNADARNREVNAVESGVCIISVCMHIQCDLQVTDLDFCSGLH